MNEAPTEIDPLRCVFAETLGQAPGLARMAGRRVMVVGAGQRPTPTGEDGLTGNGRAVSILCSREGAQVACIDVVAAAAHETVARINATGGRAFAEQADVRVDAAVAPLVERCAQRMGGLDGMVINVGITHGRSLDKITPDVWDDEFAVNLRSHMLFSQAALRLMGPGGSIVLISSLAALRNASRNPAYEVSKAALVSLARAVAVAGEDKAVRCNAVLPGLMDTPMGRDESRRRPNRAATVPFGRQGTSWEVAYACLFLLSHESTYVNAHALLIDGGLSVGVVRAPAPLSSGITGTAHETVERI